MDRVKKTLQERELEMENISRMAWDPQNGEFASHVEKPMFVGAGNVFRLPAHLRRELSAPFPAEAMHQYQGKGAKLTSIKAMWIFERLNSVFGMMGWTVDHQVVGMYDEPVREEVYEQDGKGSLKLNQWGKPIPDKARRTGKIVYTFRVLVIQARIYIRQFDLYTPYHFGWASMDDYPDNIGDAFKKAMTDAITKVAGNYLEIGVQVFKGMQDSQVANVISRFTAEEEERYKREYMREVYGDPSYPQELAQSVQHPDAQAPIPGSNQAPEAAQSAPQATAPTQQQTEATAPAPAPAENQGDIKAMIQQEYGDLEGFANAVQSGLNGHVIKEAMLKVGLAPESIDMLEFEQLTGAKKKTKNTLAAYIRVKYADPAPQQQTEATAPAPQATAPAPAPQANIPAPAPVREPLHAEEEEEEDGLAFGVGEDDGESGVAEDFDVLEPYKESCREFRSAQDFKANYKEIYSAAKDDEAVSPEDLKRLQDFMAEYLKTLKKD